MSIHFSKLPLTAVLFTHFDEKTGEQTDICVSGLEADKRTKALEVVLIPIIEDHAKLILKIRGIEDHRLKRIMQLMARTKPAIMEGPLCEPILMAEWPDGSWLNIDGSHRYAAAWKLGWSWIRAKLVPYALWQEYKVDGLPREEPERLINSFSGIK